MAMNVKFSFVATLFLVLGPQYSLTARVSIGLRSVSLSRSSLRSSSSISSARSSSASSTYGGSRYTVISARAYVYGYSAYTARRSGNNDPTVCFNNGTLSGLQEGANESTSLGYYVCPLPGDNDSMFCCCGAEEAQYCCSSWDYTIMKYSGEIFGAAGAVLVLIAFWVGVYLKRKYKRRVSRVRQHDSHAEATRQEVRPPPHSTNWSAGTTICPREDINGHFQHEPVTSSCPPDLIEGSQVTAKYPHVQCPSDVQLPRYQGDAPSQVPLCEPLPPKYEDVVLASNDFAVRSSSQ